ncbi:GIY-YIG nuclease family protein, partial [Flavobacterium psychrophilum]
MKKGFIYILSNNSLKENLFKIGKTSKSTSQRTKQLSSSTSIPESFEILHEFEFSDLNWAEREVHKELDKYRYNRKKEFFNCEIEIAKSAILKIQVIDKENQINLLKSNLEIAKKTINSNEFIKSKWSYFLNNIQWNFKEQNFLNSKS